MDHNSQKIDELLQIAEDYTTKILKTSMQMRESEMQNKSRFKSTKRSLDPRAITSKRKGRTVAEP